MSCPGAWWRSEKGEKIAQSEKFAEKQIVFHANSRTPVPAMDNAARPSNLVKQVVDAFIDLLTASRRVRNHTPSVSPEGLCGACDPSRRNACLGFGASRPRSFKVWIRAGAWAFVWRDACRAGAGHAVARCAVSRRPILVAGRATCAALLSPPGTRDLILVLEAGPYGLIHAEAQAQCLQDLCRNGCKRSNKGTCASSAAAEAAGAAAAASAGDAADVPMLEGAVGAQNRESNTLQSPCLTLAAATPLGALTAEPRRCNDDDLDIGLFFGTAALRETPGGPPSPARAPGERSSWVAPAGTPPRSLQT